jgi:hypothetical protein
MMAGAASLTPVRCKSSASQKVHNLVMTTPATTTTSTAVDRLLQVIAEGRGSQAADLYAPEAVLDATVPVWSFQKHGGTQIAAVWSGWFDEPGRFEELDRMPTPGGEVVRYLIAGEEKGTPFAVHHCHILTLDAGTGLIAQHRVWCGGRWYPARLAEMEEAQRAEG